MTRSLAIAGLAVLILPLPSAHAGGRIGVGVVIPLAGPPHYAPYYGPYPSYGFYVPYYPPANGGLYPNVTPLNVTPAAAYATPPAVYSTPSTLYVQPAQVYGQTLPVQVYGQPAPGQVYGQTAAPLPGPLPPVNPAPQN